MSNRARFFERIIGRPKGYQANDCAAMRRPSPLYYIAAALLALLLLFLVVLVCGPGDDLGAVAVILACGAIGGLVGFIFAIPKRVEAQRSTRIAEQADGAEMEPGSNYVPNTALEEISDWLTKIIVGLGLVEAARIAAFLETQGGAIAPILFGPGAAPILGGFALLAATILSFLASFLYFRVCLPEEFSLSEKRARDANRSLKEAAREGSAQQVGPRALLRAVTVSQNAAAPPSRSELQNFSAEPASPFDAAIRKILDQMREPRHPADPTKGLFGGNASVSAPFPRTLSAKVKAVPGAGEWFEIDLLVTSGEHPLEGDVVVFTHPTFPEPYEKVRAVNGEARLQLFAYGAFTVGVLADDGRTSLELDLATLPDAPRAFREN